MWIFDSIWGLIKWNAKKVGLEKATDISESLAAKWKEFIDKWAVWVKEKTPDSIDGLVDQAVAKWKIIVEEASEKVEDVVEWWINKFSTSK